MFFVAQQARQQVTPLRFAPVRDKNVLKGFGLRWVAKRTTEIPTDNRPEGDDKLLYDPDLHVAG